MTPHTETNDTRDTAPGVIGDERKDVIDGVRTYALGLVFSALLTVLAFHFTKSQVLWGPSIPMALAVFAVAQIGVHLIFFVHLTSAPDNVNNTLALAFGTLIVGLLIVGTLYIMQHLDHRLMPAMNVSERGARMQGVVLPSISVPLQSATEGVVASVDCARGAHVDPGAVCALLERAPFEKEAAQTRQAIVAAEGEVKRDNEKLAALEKRATDAKTQRRLAGAIRSARELAQRSEARVAAAKSAYAAAEAKLDQLEIVATTGGVIAARNVDVGQRVAPGARPPLFVIESETGRVDVIATVNSEAASGLQIGAPVAAIAPALGGRRFVGKITSISAVGSQPSKVEVRAGLEDPERALQSGMAVSLILQAP